MIILGSTSPTRAELLKHFGVEFTVVDGGFDEESITSTNPDRFVFEATRGKMEGCVALNGRATPIVCADTVIEVGGRIIRKAKSVDEARKILMAQSGSTLSIRTCTMVSSLFFDLIDLSATFYTFSPFDNDDLEAYLASGLWEGKAGACMVEGFCKPYIKEVRGLESTAMGLSVEKIIPFLKSFKCL